MYKDTNEDTENGILMKTDEKREIVRKLRPIDDTLFSVVYNSRKACQELLATVLGDPGLTVRDVTIQRSIKTPGCRGVRLDALCEMGDGTLKNIEVQRSNDDAHLKRVRYNAACIATQTADPGERFENLPDICVVYITEFDIFKNGRTLYHVDNIIREIGNTVDDGLTRVFVNTRVDDGSRVARLMANFMKPMPDDDREFPELYKQMLRYKCTEEGVEHMCELVENYAEKYAKQYAEKERKAGEEIGREIGKEIGREIGKEIGDATRFVKMVEKYARKKNISYEAACDELDESYDEFLAAKKLVRDGKPA